MRKLFTFFCATLLSAGMFAQETTVVFAANDKTVERTVTLPHEFLCSYYNRNGELDAIIQELYGISGGRCCDYIYPVASGNEAVSAGSYGDDNYITISAAFEGTATVSGRYWNWDAYDGDGDWMDYSLTISIKGDEPEPTTYTLQLVADPEKGSVAVTNLLGSDIVDNGNGNYTVPENAEVTILATPLEGYEFSGWKVGNIDDMVGCYYCGVALNTKDNPMTITMTEDIAYLAEFEAAQPQETAVTITEADYQGNNIFEKDGVTLTVARVDADSWYITGPGTFTNSLGKNFIKIEVTPVGGNAFIYGEGWEGDYQNKTWTGNVPTVSFNEDIQGQMEGFTATCTLEEPTGVENVQGNKVQGTKFYRDGQLLIEKNGKIYNALGAEVK